MSGRECNLCMFTSIVIQLVSLNSCSANTSFVKRAWRSSLEFVAQGELHYARVREQSRIVSEVARIREG